MDLSGAFQGESKAALLHRLSTRGCTCPTQTRPRRASGASPPPHSSSEIPTRYPRSPPLVRTFFKALYTTPLLDPPRLPFFSLRQTSPSETELKRLQLLPKGKASNLQIVLSLFSTTNPVAKRTLSQQREGLPVSRRARARLPRGRRWKER